MKSFFIIILFYFTLYLKITGAGVAKRKALTLRSSTTYNILERILKYFFISIVDTTDTQVNVMIDTNI